MAKKGKIPVGLVAGLIMTAKKIFDVHNKYKDHEDYSNIMISYLGGYHPTLKKLTLDRAMSVWAPTGIGYGISTYVGGPKGMNVNAKLRAIPIFKL